MEKTMTKTTEKVCLQKKNENFGAGLINISPCYWYVTPGTNGKGVGWQPIDEHVHLKM